MALMRRDPWFTRMTFPSMELPDLKLEEYEDDGDLVIRAEMPGIDPDKDVEITLHDHVLRIGAERRERSEKSDQEGYRSEFTYGSFQRAVRLPDGVDLSDVKAGYEDGILEIRIPFAREATTSKRIPVNRG